MGTIKRTNFGTEKGGMRRQDVNLDMVSDIQKGSESIDSIDEDLLADLPNDCYEGKVLPF